MLGILLIICYILCYNLTLHYKRATKKLGGKTNMENETRNASEYYADKGIKHLANVMLFIILSVIVYFIFFRGKAFSFENLLTLLPLTGMTLIFVIFVKSGFKIAGCLGAIIGIILYVAAVFKLDEFLIANNLPTDDSVYDPIFSTIALIYFLWHLILGIINMKNSRTIAKAQLYETQLNTQSNPIERIDFGEMAKQYEAQLDAQLNANTRTKLGETAKNE